MKYIILSLVMFFGAFSLSAQQERKLIRSGNELFDKDDFEKSEVEYRKALDKNESSFEASFNLADALFKQKKFTDALEKFQELAQKEKDKVNLSKIYHNIGNTYLEQKKLDEAIEAYKTSLRNDPSSNETKYNLEWARAQKKQQEQEDKNNQNKDNQDKNNQDSNKDKQNQDKDNQDKNKEEQNKNKDQEGQDKKEQDPNKEEQNKDKNQQSRISKDAAKRLLDALENDEKKVQEKVKKAKVEAKKAKKSKISKDW